MLEKLRILLREYVYCHHCAHRNNLDTCWNCIINNRHSFAGKMNIVRKKLWAYVWRVE